ncbi:MAG: cupredoxin domain-containing protein [Betaproteobacteria bacterium]
MPRSLFLAALLLASAVAQAADTEIALTIRNHIFTPAEVRVPAGQKIKLVVDNQDDTAEEFESHELNREKVIPPKSKGNVFIGPLKPGSYPFFGEFNASTARGVIIAE